MTIYEIVICSAVAALLALPILALALAAMVGLYRRAIRERDTAISLAASAQRREDDLNALRRGREFVSVDPSGKDHACAVGGRMIDGRLEIDHIAIIDTPVDPCEADRKRQIDSMGGIPMRTPPPQPQTGLYRPRHGGYPDGA